MYMLYVLNNATLNAELTFNNRSSLLLCLRNICVIFLAGRSYRNSSDRRKYFKIEDGKES